MSAQSAQRLRDIAASSKDQLASGVLAGLLLYPDQVSRHAEALAAFRTDDPELGRAIDDLLEAAETLEPSAISPIWAARPEGAKQTRVPFAFLCEDADPARAREELSEAIGLLIERPALEAALKAVTARFESDPEGSWAEQQRLLKRKLEFQRRLGQMASDNAAAAARDKIASPERANEQELD